MAKIWTVQPKSIDCFKFLSGLLCPIISRVLFAQSLLKHAWACCDLFSIGYIKNGGVKVIAPWCPNDFLKARASMSSKTGRILSNVNAPISFPSKYKGTPIQECTRNCSSWPQHHAMLWIEEGNRPQNEQDNPAQTRFNLGWLPQLVRRSTHYGSLTSLAEQWPSTPHYIGSNNTTASH